MNAQNSLAKNIKHFDIYKDVNTYSSFPWAVTNGDTIYIAFRQAGKNSVAAAKKDLVTHHDADSWISLVKLPSDLSDLNLQEKCEVIHNTEYGVNDPGLTLLANGNFLLRVTELEIKDSKDRHTLKGRIVSHRPEHGKVSKSRANIVVGFNGDFSEKQFTSDMVIDDLTESFSREPAIELKDGTLVASVYSGAPYNTDSAYLVRSYDQGKNWCDATVIAKDMSGVSEYQGINFNETSVLAIDDVTLIAMARADISFHTDDVFMPVGGVGNLYLCKSFNAGLSWTKPTPTKIFGQPAHLLKLSSGTIVCTYGYRKKPYGVRAVISTDNGATWKTESEIVLKDDGLMWDLGYPMTLELDNNKLLTVYYNNDENKIRYIAGTVWELQ